MKKTKIKVNVWQMGYTTFKDFKNSNKENAECRDKGYVLLDNLDDLWEETVWHLLNWGCWNYNEKEGKYIKPKSVKSPLTHCNSDVILNIEGTNIYKYAKSVGFGEATSLDEAKTKMVEGFCKFWPFPEVTI